MVNWAVALAKPVGAAALLELDLAALDLAVTVLAAPLDASVDDVVALG